MTRSIYHPIKCRDYEFAQAFDRIISLATSLRHRLNRGEFNTVDALVDSVELIDLCHQHLHRENCKIKDTIQTPSGLAAIYLLPVPTSWAMLFPNGEDREGPEPSAFFLRAWDDMEFNIERLHADKDNFDSLTSARFRNRVFNLIWCIRNLHEEGTGKSL